MDPREEEQFRDLIRRELENRERLRGSDEHRLPKPENVSEDRQRIIEDEIAAFYRAKGGYRRVVNEEGEVEWLTEQELQERDGQLPVDMEELEDGQRRVRNRILLFVLLGLFAVALVFVLMRERTGSIQVICNVPATIMLNGSPTEFMTDNRLDHLPVGPHVISVSKYGYVPDGDAGTKVDLKAGRSEVVVLKLKPQSTDSLGRSR
jgi:hypothetical protein